MRIEFGNRRSDFPAWVTRVAHFSEGRTGPLLVADLLRAARSSSARRAASNPRAANMARNPRQAYDADGRKIPHPDLMLA